MAKTRITKKDRFNQLLAIEEVQKNQDLVDFIRHEMEQLDKKNASNRKPTEKQETNANIARSIVELMSNNPDTLYTITDLQKILPDLPEDMTNQRMSAIVRTLLEKNGTGEVERIEDKRKTYFRIAR